jgi:small subunit ribosomal protein S17
MKKEILEKEDERGMRKTRSGVVVSNKMAKTVVVRVERTFRHPLYGKVMKGSKKYYAHSESAEPLNIGDAVKIEECRPMSRMKRWRVVEQQSK